MDKIKRLLFILSQFSIDDVLELEEKYDEQYKALQYLFNRIDNPPTFSTLVLLNALVSYQLNCTGEKYWWEFAEYFSRKTEISIIRDMISFLTESKCNKRLKPQKINKIMKTRSFIDHLLTNFDFFSKDLLSLWKLVYLKLNMKGTAKTVVFSIKMFNYAIRISTRVKSVLPFDIPIPLDYRILKITNALGVNKKRQISFWNEVARDVGIPPLHLDSLLWIAFRFASYDKNIEIKNKLERLIKFLDSLLQDY